MNIENIGLDKSVEVKAIGKAWGGELWVIDDGPGMIKDVLKLAVVIDGGITFKNHWITDLEGWVIWYGSYLHKRHWNSFRQSGLEKALSAALKADE